MSLEVASCLFVDIKSVRCCGAVKSTDVLGKRATRWTDDCVNEIWGLPHFA